ncbi:CAP domain-containing protein [Brunnivagina elsteri]|uniref:Alkaline-shock protein n=1 Tax=Brunnivagina elsteri CCALA 953 TaxID=987040 RepID=A0A2A2TPW2_9CYAN|nr:CAP domain-containing protein [Calothrix elsteri]PAX60465.1 alkaline-shock protein [Calothrix elsteri CCALA 953]
MNQKSYFGIAFSTLLSASYLVSLPTSTSANTLSSSNRQLSKSVIEVAQATNVDTNGVERSIFEQINQYRASKGLSPFTRNSKIDSQAKNHSQNIASGKAGFGHGGFSERIKATGISYRGAAENVAYNQGYKDSATQAVQGWIKSPGHRGNIEGKFSQTGIGVATNGKGEIYFTQIFLNNR